jgi:phage N-6-adenine-methyltransferase
MNWRTPDGLFVDLHREFSFTVDACASPENALLPRYWTEGDEGLMQPWQGERVWMNPPYGPQVRRWMEKAWTEARSAELIVALVAARTDTEWWHRYALDSSEIRFVRNRLRFDGTGGRAPFPSAIVIWC